MTDARDTTNAAWIRKALDHHEASLVRYAARLTGNLDLGREVATELLARPSDNSRLSLKSNSGGKSVDLELQPDAYLYGKILPKPTDIRRLEAQTRIVKNIQSLIKRFTN